MYISFKGNVRRGRIGLVMKAAGAETGGRPNDDALATWVLVQWQLVGLKVPAT